MATKRWTLLLVLGLLILGVAVGPGSAQQTTSFFLQAIGDNNEEITSGRCRINTAGTNTAATIYSDGALSSTATNPITMNTSTGLCTFYLPSGTSAVDAILLIDGGPYKGARVRVDNVTRGGQHTVRVPRQHSVKIIAIPFSQTTGNVPTTSTTATLPGGALITNAVVQVTSAASQFGARIDVGTTATSHGTSGTGSLCSSARIDQAQFVSCDTASQALPARTTNWSVTYSTSGHSASGFIWIAYIETGNEP